jgi:transcriptional regulator with XRE-family HTH domain
VIDPLLLVLRAERLDRGLSMRQAGELIGNETYASIYNWESEKTSPTLRSLRRWADSLGFDVVLRRRGEAS